MEVGAHVGKKAHPHRGELAVGIGRQLDVLDLAAAVGGGDGVLAAGLVPAHRPAQLEGQGDAEQLFGVDVELAAEAAAHSGSDDAELVLGHAQGDGGHHLQDVGHLGGGVEGQIAAEGLGHGAHGAGLHGDGDQPLLHISLADLVGGVGEGLVDLAGSALDLEVPLVALVGTEVRVDDDPVAECVFEVNHRGLGLVPHIDQLGGVARGGLAGGEHHGYPVTYVAGLGGRKWIVGGVLHVCGDRPGARHGCCPQVGQVCPCERGHHPGGGKRGIEIDAGDHGVGVRAAHHHHVQGTGHDQVVGELGLSGEQGRVFAAEKPGAQHGCRTILYKRHLGTPSTYLPVIAVASVSRRRRRPAPT